jgi:hypothetical protein
MNIISSLQGIRIVRYQEPILKLEGPFDQISEQDIRTRLESEFNCHITKVKIDESLKLATVELATSEELKIFEGDRQTNTIKIRGNVVRRKIHHTHIYSVDDISFCLSLSF